MKTLESIRQLAYHAHSGTSFSPERRAESIVNDYSEELDQDLKELAEKGSSPEKIEQYKTRYIELLTHWLSAKSQCMSSMIAGPSNFPVRRAEKANNREQAKYEEFTTYRENAFKWSEKAERKREIEEAGGPLEVAKKKLEMLENTQEYMKKINKAHAAYVKNPNSILNNTELSDDERDIILCFVPQYSWIKHPFAPYQLTNNNAMIKNTKDRIAELEKKEENASGENKETPFEGGVITLDYSLDRITIKHDQKPGAEIITMLKKNGFKWSPHYGVWMRKITDNALWSLKKYVLPILIPVKSNQETV